MREYELTIIVHPEVDESAFNEILERIQGWITEAGGEVAKIDHWGKRKLAYQIRKQSEGTYVLMHTNLPTQFGAELERNLRFLEPIMRFMLIAK